MGRDLQSARLLVRLISSPMVLGVREAQLTPPPPPSPQLLGTYRDFFCLFFFGIFGSPGLPFPHPPLANGTMDSRS